MKTKLTKGDWLAHGLKALSVGGYRSLKVDNMASELGVSRGSFYWHFKDISAFYQELLEFWKQQSTSLVIKELDQSMIVEGRLHELIRRGFSFNTPLEKAFRFWANQNDAVAALIQEIDAERECYIVKLFKLSGFPEEVAQLRARFLYWAYLGRMLSLNEHSAWSNLDITDDLARLLLQQ